MKKRPIISIENLNIILNMKFDNASFAKLNMPSTEKYNIVKTKNLNITSVIKRNIILPT